jgi:hypothetical protein
MKNNPQAALYDYSDVNTTLQELVEQQRELEQKRQFLVLKHQGLSAVSSITSVDSSPQFQASTASLPDQAGYIALSPLSASSPEAPFLRPTRLSLGYNCTDMSVNQAFLEVEESWRQQRPQQANHPHTVPDSNMFQHPA